MLEVLQLRNFQKHEKFRVQFGQVTTFVGPSDAGKSAVIRAIRWVCINTPAGEAFKRHGADMVAVRLLVDGRVVVRSRGKSDNLYKLDDAEFRAFGSDIPDSIVAALNLGPINFQFQHSSPFWLSESAGEVSRQLNAIVDLGVVDEATANATRGVRDATQHVQLCEQHVEAYAKALDDAAWSIEAEREFSVIEKLQEVSVHKQGKVLRLSRAVEAASTAATSWEEERQKLRDLEGLESLAKVAAQRHRNADKLRAAMRAVPEVPRAPKLSEISDIDALKTKSENLSDKASKLREGLERAVYAIEMLQKRQRDLKEIEAELSEFEACPLCGSSL